MSSANEIPSEDQDSTGQFQRTHLSLVLTARADEDAGIIDYFLAFRFGAAEEFSG